MRPDLSHKILIAYFYTKHTKGSQKYTGIHLGQIFHYYNVFGNLLTERTSYIQNDSVTDGIREFK